MILSKYTRVLSACLFLFHLSNSNATTSLGVSGYAGAVGSFYGGLPTESKHTSYRVPLGLLLQASPTDQFTLYLGLDYAFNNYPKRPVLLGQTSSNNETNPSGSYTSMPFAYSVNGTSTNGQKVDVPFLTQAYLMYSSEIGLFRAGRMPRHWGLGAWNNAEWSATGSGISTSDALSLLGDFGLFDVTLYAEKYGESLGGSSDDGDANAYTVEARLKTDPNDVPSSGISREVGFAFSKFSHKQSDTQLNIIDVYGKFYFPRFFIGGELLYPSGNTKNPNYQTLGGSAECIPNSGLTCSEQKISAFGGLFKLKTRIDSSVADATLYSVERTQKMLGTKNRQESHIAEFWAGYATGGENQFDAASRNASDNRITAIRLNPNIQPALIMFNNVMPMVDGMPTASITNAVFTRLAYGYEHPSAGLVEGALIWGRLNKLNPVFATCTVGTTGPDGSLSVNPMCVGGNKDLGAELDVKYSYTTLDRITAGVEAGYWFTGKAWEQRGKVGKNSFAVRASLSTQF